MKQLCPHLFLFAISFCPFLGTPPVDDGSMGFPCPIVQQNPQPGPDIEVPSILKVRAGHIYKVQARTALKQLKWITLDPDIQLIPSDDGRWAVISIDPNANTRGQAMYRVGVYGAKTVGNEAVPTDPVYIDLYLDVPPLPPGPVPPGPNPPVPPGPTPGPAPIPDAGNRVLITFDPAKIGDIRFIFNPVLRDYLNAKCIAGPDGKTKDWWILKKDENVSSLPQMWQNAMKLPKSQPWIVISTGSTGYSGPLPTTIDATMDLLKKYFGN